MAACEARTRDALARAAVFLVILLAPAAAAAQLGDIGLVREAASAAAARSHELAARGGAGYEREVLDAVRRSCAGREVTRLDLLEPASATSEASPTPAGSLLDLTLANADALVARVDQDTETETTGSGLVLKKGQVRTTGAFALARDAIGTIEIDVASAAPGHMLLGWSEAADAPRLRRNNTRIELVGDSRVHTYAIDAADALTRGLAAGASVRRFFLASRSAAPIMIRALRVLSRAQRFTGSHGTAHEERAGELRSVLYMRVPAALEYDVDVPAQSPVLEAGLAAVTTGGVIEFEVAVVDGEARTVLVKRLVKNAPWENVSLDLAPWAGKRVRISLATRGMRDAVALWSSPLVRARRGDEATQPVLVLLEDALRADRLGVYGGPVASPAHERIAAAGVVFDRAFSQASQTRSSVPSLMTSLLPSTNGTWDFSDSLSERFVTLAEVLRACGFATGSFVQNGNAGTYAGLAQGFDVVFGEESFGPRAADILSTSSALEGWIARQRGRPWFAYVHVLDPHGPYDPAERPDLAAASGGEALLRDRSIDAEWLENPTADARRLLYDAEVAANDRALGAFLDRLDARGDLARATLAVVADHGEFLGEHGGLWRHHPPAHAEVARVPFLLRAPGVTARRIAQPVGLLDLMPTVLDLAGVDASPLVMQGRSLAAALRSGGALPLRAIAADEMILDEGERRARACGSFATPDALYLRSCTRDEDFTPGKLLAARSGGPAPLIVTGLDPLDFGVEKHPGTLSRFLLESATTSALETVQSAGLDAWRSITGAAAARIVSEPATAERLRALGYAH